MRHYYFLYIFLCIVFAMLSCSEETQPPREEPIQDFMLGGIQVNEPDQQQWMRTLKDVGMNTVSITVYARQGIWNKSSLWWDTTLYKNVIHEIATAKAENMQVVLIPRLMLDHYFEENRFLWHGMVLPEGNTAISKWFEHYTKFVMEWAVIAEKYNVDVLGIGSEMRSLVQTQPVDDIPFLESFYMDAWQQAQYIQDRVAFKEELTKEHLWVRGEENNYADLATYLEDKISAKLKWAKTVAYAETPSPIDSINARRAHLLQEWYQLIDTVRATYSGPLTYAANFDNYHNIAFWDKLDFIGINAYFKLRDYNNTQSSEEKYIAVKEAWNGHFQDILQFQKTQNIHKQVIFTELGYIYRNGCTAMPWEGFGFSISRDFGYRELIIWSKQAVNFEERANAIKALRETDEHYNLLKGILYWKFSTNVNHLDIEPFMMHLGPDSEDPMQSELVKFLE